MIVHDPKLFLQALPIFYARFLIRSVQAVLGMSAMYYPPTGKDLLVVGDAEFYASLASGFFFTVCCTDKL
jgi:hypothetical protein